MHKESGYGANTVEAGKLMDFVEILLRLIGERLALRGVNVEFCDIEDIANISDSWPYKVRFSIYLDGKEI